MNLAKPTVPSPKSFKWWYLKITIVPLGGTRATGFECNLHLFQLFMQLNLNLSILILKIKQHVVIYYSVSTNLILMLTLYVEVLEEDLGRCNNYIYKI